MILLSLPPPALKLQEYTARPRFYGGAGDLNSGLHAYTARTVTHKERGVTLNPDWPGTVSARHSGVPDFRQVLGL